MVGESKKRSKTSSTSSAVAASPVKISKEDVFNNAIEFEEKEEQKFNRDQFKTCFNELNKLIQEVAELKTKEGDEEIKKKITEKRIQGSLIVVKLKKLNRLDKIRLANRRESLAKEKLNVDSNRLKLQNLIYEADHLKKEINKCISFKSEDEDIELVDLEEFMAKASEESKSTEILDDKHALRMARLEFELQQRKEYASQCQELEKCKEEIAQKIVSVRENLDSLEPCLINVCKATRPIQKILEMPFESEWETQKIVRLLPQSLYMAYTKLCAYSEVIDKNLIVSIDGNEDEAHQLEIERKQGKQDDTGADENEDSENEPEENDFEESDNRRKVQRRQSRVESMNQKREKLFTHHPLSVRFQLKSKNHKEILTVTLNYLPEMGIVTVQGKFNIENASQSVSAGDIITQDRILSSLYQDDYGVESPNPKSSYQLQNVQFNPEDLSRMLDEKKLGKPFKWAQRLCGICFTSKLNIDDSYKLCEETVPLLIRQMRKRINARMKLFHQIQSLEIGRITSSGRISSILQQFVALSFAEYSAIPSTKKFIDEEIVSSNDLYYRSIVTRGSAKLECHIAVPGNFPNEYPIFALGLSYDDNKYNADNSSHIREIEGFVNGMKVDKIDNILPLQLQRAMTSLDIFLETETSHDGSKEFNQEKNYSCSYRGKLRSRPYQPKTLGCTTSFKHIGY